MANNDNVGGGYPRGPSPFIGGDEKTLKPSDHFRQPVDSTTLNGSNLLSQHQHSGGGINRDGYQSGGGSSHTSTNGNDHSGGGRHRGGSSDTDAVKSVDNFLFDNSEHFTRDVNDIGLSGVQTYYERSDGSRVPIFSGATTNINPLKDADKQEIIDGGLESHEQKRVRDLSMLPNGNQTMADIIANAKGGKVPPQPPLSPLHPFTRMDPKMAQVATLTTYNRTKIPIADLEFRKGFRHIFITRPECYIMAHNPNTTSSSDMCILSEQAEYDTDFASCYSRMPHILKLLSPIYVSGAFSQNGIPSNWNYLMSNRALGISSPVQSSMTVSEDIPKSIEGYTVTPASHVESRQGSTIDIKFRDTKNLEVYEMNRMWMLYMHKRKRGEFAPPYNSYQYRNGFLRAGRDGLPVYNKKMEGLSQPYALTCHPYDRALEYCATIYDIVTNESMTKILYWCKYYGVYPTSASVDGLTNDLNGPITNEMTTTVTFKYQYKLENDNRSLVEFNYNAGITDDLGRVTKAVESSYPFLLKDDPNDPILKHHVGAAGMFTGSPYIVLGKSQNDPLNVDNDILVPYLRFMPLTNERMNSELNMGITNVQQENDAVIGLVDEDYIPPKSSNDYGSENNGGPITLQGLVGAVTDKISDGIDLVTDAIVDNIKDSTGAIFNPAGFIIGNASELVGEIFDNNK